MGEGVLRFLRSMSLLWNAMLSSSLSSLTPHIHTHTSISLFFQSWQQHRTAGDTKWQAQKIVAVGYSGIKPTKSSMAYQSQTKQNKQARQSKACKQSKAYQVIKPSTSLASSSKDSLSKLNTKNSTKRRWRRRLVEFLVFNRASLASQPSKANQKKQANKHISKQASERASKQSTKQASERASKRASKQPTYQPTKQPTKQASKQTNQASK